MNKKEIKEKLVAQGIEFDEDATNKELFALLPEEEGEDKEEEVKEETKEVKEEKSSKAEKLSPFLEAYKLQNPRKFKTKLANGELNGL